MRIAAGFVLPGCVAASYTLSSGLLFLTIATVRLTAPLAPIRLELKQDHGLAGELRASMAGASIRGWALHVVPNMASLARSKFAGAQLRIKLLLRAGLSAVSSRYPSPLRLPSADILSVAEEIDSNVLMVWKAFKS